MTRRMQVLLLSLTLSCAALFTLHECCAHAFIIRKAFGRLLGDCLGLLSFDLTIIACTVVLMVALVMAFSQLCMNFKK